MYQYLLLIFLLNCQILISFISGNVLYTKGIKSYNISSSVFNTKEISALSKIWAEDTFSSMPFNFMILKFHEIEFICLSRMVLRTAPRVLGLL